MKRHLFFVAALATACGGSSLPAATITADTTPITISFNADWTVSQSGPLTPGGQAILHYSADRLPGCRAEVNGLPSWNLFAELAVDGHFTREIQITTLLGGGRLAAGQVENVDTPVTVPLGQDLAIWFKSTDATGCVAYDSAFGRNYHFALSAPTLTFGADWTVTASAPLVQGTQVNLAYATDRLPRCRATEDSVQAWGIVAFYQGNGVGTAQWANQVSVFPASTPPVLQLPFASDLAVWFMNTDASGCTAYDSSYGQNFHFTLAPPPSPVIHFRPDFTTTVDGTLRAGGDLLVDYDSERLPTCRQAYGGPWDITADYQFDGGPVAQASLTTTAGTTTAGTTAGRMQAPAHLYVPAGAHTLTLWFENTDSAGCQEWDSAYGANYSFPLQ